MRRSKQAGINFLNDPKVAERIVSCVDFSGRDVLEIGAGLGQLTKFIKGYRNFTIIEREADFADRLKADYPEINIINGDALITLSVIIFSGSLKPFTLDFRSWKFLNGPFFLSSRISHIRFLLL